MNSTSKLSIYYFSGTGNSRNTALWFEQTGKNKGLITELIDISKINRIDVSPPPPGALVVFTSPIHGFNFPPVMMHFIARFPKGHNKVVLMNTRAGMLLGKWITPGLTGIAFYFSALMLHLKGYRLQGTCPVDMPSNWISLHPGLNERTVKYLHIRNKERVEKFANAILSGKRVFRGRLEMIQNLLVAPIAVLYYAVGRFGLAKTFYASAACDRCDLCLKNCPVKAIIKIDKRPYWTFRCESCMKCMGNCPRKAIETAHGFIIAMVIINSALVMHWLYKQLIVLQFQITSSVIRFVLESVIFLLLLAISYRIMHYLLKFKPFEKLMVYTSLTKLRFWRRYKALRHL